VGGCGLPPLVVSAVRSGDSGHVAVGADAAIADEAEESWLVQEADDERCILPGERVELQADRDGQGQGIIGGGG
jgi:hypothetical protein